MSYWLLQAVLGGPGSKVCSLREWGVGFEGGRGVPCPKIAIQLHHKELFPP